MKNSFIGLLIIIMIITAVFLAGCGNNEPAATTTPSASVSATATVTAGEPEYASAMTEELLTALNDGDYETYSAHFDEAMKQALTEAVFNQTSNLVRSKIGNYLSKEFVKVETPDGYVRVTYKVKYSDEPADAAVAVVFKETEDGVLVSGIWLDSPKLRQP